MAEKYIEARTYYFQNIKGPLHNYLRETKMLPGDKTMFVAFPQLDEFFTGKEHGFNTHNHFQMVFIAAAIFSFSTLCLSCCFLRCLCGCFCASKASKPKTAEKEKTE